MTKIFIYLDLYSQNEKVRVKAEYIDFMQKK